MNQQNEEEEISSRDSHLIAYSKSTIFRIIIELNTDCQYIDVIIEDLK